MNKQQKADFKRLTKAIKNFRNIERKINKLEEHLERAENEVGKLLNNLNDKYGDEFVTDMLERIE